MAYSKDTRELMLKYRANGHTLEQIHNEFGISISTIREWETLLAESGSLEKKELNRSARIYKSDELHAFIAENPDAFLREIAEHFGGSVTGAFNALEREKITYKEKECEYEERDEEKRAEFDEKLEEIPPDTPVVYIDESGIDKHLHRKKGRAPKGKKVKKKTKGRRFKRRNVIAGLCGKNVLAQCTYGWGTDTVWFSEWFEWSLIPALTLSSVIIMDNASFHNHSVLETIAEAYGHRVLWLPSYSPDKNPIEHLWANLKTWLRSFAENYATIQQAIFEYFNKHRMVMV